MQTNARGYLNTASSDLSALLAEKKSLDSIKQTIVTDQNNMTLLKVGNGTGDNPISLQIEQNNLLKQERDLETLKSNLNDYTIVAPFAGTIASVTATVGSQAGTIASLVTNQQVAQLSLNEIDATKVAIGQKATLTFDAISDLSLTGTVAEIDPVGTVSQGVVSYTIKITFDTQDPRIKPGMTVNASVQSQVRQDILSVPSSAVKTSNGQSYILAFDPPLADTGTTTGGVTSKIAPVQIPVQTGISDDTNIEIISGLTEGQQIVSRTITATSKTTTTTTRSATSLIGGGGGNQGGGIRIGG
jgi:HlyD family secretion protein